jgi:hypothetical protein
MGAFCVSTPPRLRFHRCGLSRCWNAGRLPEEWVVCVRAMDKVQNRDKAPHPSPTAIELRIGPAFLTAG